MTPNEAERHRAKMQKRKTVQDAEVAQKTIEKGLARVCAWAPCWPDGVNETWPPTRSKIETIGNFAPFDRSIPPRVTRPCPPPAAALASDCIICSSCGGTLPVAPAIADGSKP